jgi:hypothetical protein
MRDAPQPGNACWIGSQGLYQEKKQKKDILKLSKVYLLKNSIFLRKSTIKEKKLSRFKFNLI